MNNARPVRYLQPMTMADILRPDAKLEREKTKAALRRSKLLKRFPMWVAVAASCAVSGMSLGAIVGPPIVEQFGLSVADDQFDDVGRASGAHVAAGGKAPSKADESVPAGSQSSSRSSATSSKFSGRASATPSSNSSGRASTTSSSNSSGGASDTPEPSSFVLLAIGGLTLGGLAIRTRRRSCQ
jgi:PEP-CTERM motif